jgi:hypothetical protein
VSIILRWILFKNMERVRWYACVSKNIEILQAKTYFGKGQY